MVRQLSQARRGILIFISTTGTRGSGRTVPLASSTRANSVASTSSSSRSGIQKSLQTMSSTSLMTTRTVPSTSKNSFALSPSLHAADSRKSSNVCLLDTFCCYAAHTHHNNARRSRTTQPSGRLSTCIYAVQPEPPYCAPLT